MSNKFEKMKSLIWGKLTGRNWTRLRSLRPQKSTSNLSTYIFFLNHSHHHLKSLVFRISISILWYSVRDILIWNCVGSTPEKHHNTKIFTRLSLLYKRWPRQYWKYRLTIKSLKGASWSSETCISRVLVWSPEEWEEEAQNRGAHQVAELVAAEAAIWKKKLQTTKSENKKSGWARE